jgi:MerR family transcriptional regulator, heat shock protein HspR
MLDWCNKKFGCEWGRWVLDKATTRSARGVYGISVAAELSGLDPQTLRLFERRGLLSPGRTKGGTRRYSDDDMARLQRITDLFSQGVNLVGVAQILSLQDRNAQLQSDNVRLTSRRGPDQSAQAAGHDRRRRS